MFKKFWRYVKYVAFLHQQQLHSLGLQLLPLLFIPIVRYIVPYILPFLNVSGPDNYLIRAITPGICAFISVIVFQGGKRGAFGHVLSLIICTYFSIMYAWYGYLGLIAPILPKSASHLWWFAQNAPWLDFAKSLASLSVTSLVSIRFVIDVVGGKIKTKSVSHGSAGFATQSNIMKVQRISGLPIGHLVQLPESQNLAHLKQSVDRGFGPLVRLDPAHAILIAPSGAGKGVGFIVPMLLDYDGPVVVTDVKGAENFYITARHRRRGGRTIYIFDPAQKTKETSVRINVLSLLNPNDHDFIEQVIMLAEIIIPMPAGTAGNTQYFASQAASLVAAMMIHVICDPKIEAADKHLGTVYDLICLDKKHMFEFIKQRIEELDVAGGFMSRIFSALQATHGEEASGIYNTARVELRFVDTPVYRELLGSMTLDMEALLSGQADLFLCVPTEILATHGRIIRLTLAMLFKRLQNQNRRVAKDLLFILDEMPLIGYMPQIENILIAGRVNGIRIIAISQTLELLRKAYPNGYKTFLSSELVMFLGSKDIDTCQQVSKMLGQTTIEVASSSTSDSSQKGERNRSNSTSQSKATSLISRELLKDDEVRILGNQAILAFYKQSPPMLLKKILYYKNKTWKGLYDPNPFEQKPFAREKIHFKPTIPSPEALSSQLGQQPEGAQPLLNTLPPSPCPSTDATLTQQSHQSSLMKEITTMTESSSFETQVTQHQTTEPSTYVDLNILRAQIDLLEQLSPLTELQQQRLEELKVQYEHASQAQASNSSTFDDFSEDPGLSSKSCIYGYGDQTIASSYLLMPRP